MSLFLPVGFVLPMIPDINYLHLTSIKGSFPCNCHTGLGEKITSAFSCLENCITFSFFQAFNIIF